MPLDVSIVSRRAAGAPRPDESDREKHLKDLRDYRDLLRSLGRVEMVEKVDQAIERLREVSREHRNQSDAYLAAMRRANKRKRGTK